MSAERSASPPAGAQAEAVLGEVLIQQRAISRQQTPEEDPDLALAKLLQAQEQAWLAMAGQGSGILENLPPAGGAAGSPGAGSPGGEGSAEAAGEGEGPGEELTDEEMARRMQEEEEREFQQRLLALAGMGPPGAGGAGEEAGGGEYASEDEVDPDDMTYEELTALGEAVGTVSKGITQAEVEALPQQEYHEVAGTTAGSEEQCPICRVEYEPEDTVRVLPLCSHYYHPDCISEWLKRNKVCCICNKEVLEEGKQAAATDTCSGGVLGERRQQ